MSEPLVEQHLLAGAIALQLGFLDRSAFLQTLRDWINDRSQPLTEFLVARHALSRQEQAVLDALVQAHLQRHSNDATQSLATLASRDPSLAESLQGIRDADLERSLHAQTVRSAEGQSPALPNRSGNPNQSGNSNRSGNPHPAGLSPRFRILRAHARGGLGEVFVAHDDEVPREVALKQIQQRHADDPQSRARFLLEAEITGGLEHPGIVPVYGLGTHPDGRPYYAMRFIRGDSLKEAIERFHQPALSPSATSTATSTANSSATSTGTAAATSARLRLNDPARTLAFRKLLGRFVDVCQAMAYAHSRGVLHRDLKPGNIMLGKYGETLVVDWGLAKPQRSADSIGAADPVATEAPLIPSQSSASAPTMTGEFLGTPGFASPEQASGRIDLLGPASDIYSLGGTLYAILTGQPPHQGRDIRELLRQITTGDIARPRARVPDVPAALEAVCLKALALQPNQRYDTAQALAEDVEHYLADESVTAYRESRFAQLKRFARKRPSLTAGLAATILIGLISSGLFSAILSYQYDALAQANVQLQFARNQALTNEAKALTAAHLAEQRRLDADQQKRAAETQRALAQQEQQRVEQAMEFLVTAFQRPDPALDGRDLKVVDLLIQAEETIPAKIQDAKMQAKLFGTLSRTYAGLGIPERATASAAQTYRIRAEDLGAEAPQTLLARMNLATLMGENGQLAESLPMLEEVIPKLKSSFGDDHPSTLQSLNNLANAYLAAGKFAQGLSLHEDLTTRAKAARGPDHETVLFSLHNLGMAYQRCGQSDKAIPIFQGVLRRQEATLGKDDPGTLQTLASLAIAYQSGGQTSRALVFYEDLLTRLRAKLGPEHLSTLRCMNNLALAYQNTNQFPQALALYDQALRLQRAKLGPDHPLTLQTQGNWAVSLMESGEREKAVQVFEATLEKQRATLGIDHPDTLNGINNLAYAYLEMKKPAQAFPLFTEALRQRQSKWGPVHPQTLNSLHNLVRAYLATRQPEQALALLEDLYQTLAKESGADSAGAREIESSLLELAESTGQWSKLVPLAKRVLERHTKEQGPDHPLTLAAQAKWGTALLKSRAYVEAETCLLALEERTATTKDAALLNTRKHVLSALVELYTSWNRPDEAAVWAKRRGESSRRP